MPKNILKPVNKVSKKDNKDQDLDLILLQKSSFKEDF